MSLVGPERALHGLVTVVAAELSSDIDRLVRNHLEDLFVARVEEIETDWCKASLAVLPSRFDITAVV